MIDDADELIEIAAKTNDVDKRTYLLARAYRKKISDATSDEEVHLYRYLYSFIDNSLAQLKKIKEVVSVPKNIVQ